MRNDAGAGAIKVFLDAFFSMLERMGDTVVDGFHLLGLCVIGASVIWAAGGECLDIFSRGHPGLKDILMLFIYLELGAMVGIYFKTKRLPVRYLLYIAITALTRILAIDVKTMTDVHMLAISVCILLLAVAVLLLRIGSDNYPAPKDGEVSGD